MEFIRGVTFGFMSRRGDFETDEARESLRLLKTHCAADTVILAIVVEQATAQSTEINWQADTVVSDQEVKDIIAFAQEIGLKVILKPMVNVSDGTWRAHINFFDMDIPCEPKWSDWFKSYTDYMLHYAKIAEESQCEMLVIGCELVNADRRSQEWRELISLVRAEYNGLLTYNCDKYQEDHLQWWDALDVISSSGYYPIDQWETQLDRIEKIVTKHQKPFFFCEVGCPSREGSQYLPNDWTQAGAVNMSAQAEWYQAMFTATNQRPWVQGFSLWDWKTNLYPIELAKENDDYAIYGKTAATVIHNYYSKQST